MTDVQLAPTCIFFRMSSLETGTRNQTLKLVMSHVSTVADAAVLSNLIRTELYVRSKSGAQDVCSCFVGSCLNAAHLTACCINEALKAGNVTVFQAGVVHSHVTFSSCRHSPHNHYAAMVAFGDVTAKDTRKWILDPTNLCGVLDVA
jgi:hypothetical protein